MKSLSRYRAFALWCALGAALGCKAYDPPQAATGLYDACCGGQGTCVPEGLLDDALAEQLGRDSCERALVCAPTELALDPDAVPKTCHAQGELEGRCVPSCLPAVAAQAERLVRADCEREQLCLPCFDPLSGQDTGACHLGGDPGPRQAPRVFDTCCSGLGRCVPSASLVPADRARVATDSCDEDARAVCVPSAWLSDPIERPKACRTSFDGEGRCLPSCLPELARQAEQLEQGACEQGALCVPCFDPRDGSDTQACRTDGDEPRDPPVLLTSCCEGLGTCLAQSLLDEAQRERLPVDECAAAADQVCVPSAWLDGAPPASCRAPGQLEGRCFPSCLPEVAEQRDQLTQSTCRTHELCLPCFDPLTGEDTEACRTDNDPGPQDAPEPFAVCCGELGRCLPRSLVPEDARAGLERDSCAASYDALCTPSAWIEGRAPASCHAPGQLEGRCLPRCLPQVAQLGELAQQADCPAEHACLPCFDPLTGQESGACATPGDEGPREPAIVFDRCCPDGEDTLGTCVPSSSLPDAQVAAVPKGLCAEGFTCAPDALVRTPQIGLSACVSRLLGIGPAQPGACVPQCLLGTNAFALSRASCAAAERCVPCSSLPLETAACD